MGSPSAPNRGLLQGKWVGHQGKVAHDYDPEHLSILRGVSRAANGGMDTYSGRFISPNYELITIICAVP